MDPGSFFFEKVVMWSLGMRGWITPYIECCARIFKHGQDHINLSKMHPVFVWRTDRTCEVLSNYLELKIVKDPFYDSSFIRRTNNCQDSTEKIGRTVE